MLFPNILGRARWWDMWRKRRRVRRSAIVDIQMHSQSLWNDVTIIDLGLGLFRMALSGRARLP